ncbi:MAG: hypothetical protein RLN76_09925 [Phycisphaeraceae bacterium]
MNDVSHEAIRQLEHGRERAQRLALMQHLVRGLVVALAALMALGVFDFLFRLPMSLRLIGWFICVYLIVQWVRRIADRHRWHSSLVAFALSVERLRPAWRGRLAAAVDLAEGGDRDTLARAFREAAQSDLPEGPLDLEPLLDRRPLVRTARVAGLLVGVWLVFALLAPSFAGSALSRWLWPWAAGPWPTMTRMELLDTERVRPLGVPVHVQVRTPDSSADRRIVLNATWTVDEERFESANQIVLTRSVDEGSTEAIFETRLEPPAALLRHLTLNAVDVGAVAIELTTGWDQYQPEPLPLATRPRLTEVIAEIAPPAYAEGLLEERAEALNLDGGSATLRGLEGSAATLRLRLARPTDQPEIIVAEDQKVDFTLSVGERDSVVSWVITPGTPVFRVDAESREGLRFSRPPEVRSESIEDRPPSVRLIEPATDQRVLPAATVSLHAQVTDDVGVDSLRLTHRRDGQDHDQAVVISDRIERSVSLELVTDWPLASLGLRAGDVLLVTASAEDVRQNPIQHAADRRIIVVDEATFRDLLREEMSLLDRRIGRALSEQRRLMGEGLESASAGQEQLAARIGELAEAARALEQRQERNRFDDASLREMVQRLGEGLDRAAEAARDAEQALGASDNEAGPQAEAGRASQQQAANELEALRAMLDDNSAAMQAAADLRDLAEQQRALAQRSAELLPQTLGQNPEDLPQELREQLEQLARDQQRLAEQTRQTVEQLRAQADDLAEQADNPRAQDLARALREAADAAESAQISGQMSEAGERVEDNQLSRAGSQQQAIAQQLDAIAQGFEQSVQDLEDQQDQLASLVDVLQEIIAEQNQQRQRTQATSEVELEDIAGPAQALRLRTLDALEQVEALEDHPAAEAGVRDAADSQTQAIRALRSQRQQLAVDAQEAAEQSLISALEALEARLEENEAQAAAERRSALQKAYRGLAEREDELRVAVESLRPRRPLATRRLGLAAVADDQWALRDEAQDLAEEVAETAIFAPLHERIADLADRITRQLRIGYAENDVLRSQQEIADTLRLMADALDEPPQDPEQEEGGSEGGGGSGGQQGEPELVPSMAELRLVRALQEQILLQTQALREAVEEPLTPDQRDALQVLSIRQRDLARYANRLTEEQNP